MKVIFVFPINATELEFFLSEYALRKNAISPNLSELIRGVHI